MSFSFHRGSLALDFVGTVGRRTSAEPEERLPDPAALGTWLRAAGLPAPARVAEADLAEARALREALYALGLRTLRREPLDSAAVRVLNAAARGRVHGALQLDQAGEWSWWADDPLHAALGQIAEDAVVCFTVERERLARCELDGCGALLLSRSRSDPRRWCSMETCGNRAKAAAFRARRRQRTSGR